MYYLLATLLKDAGMSLLLVNKHMCLCWLSKFMCRSCPFQQAHRFIVCLLTHSESVSDLELVPQDLVQITHQLSICTPCSCRIWKATYCNMLACQC